MISIRYSNQYLKDTTLTGGELSLPIYNLHLYKCLHGIQRTSTHTNTDETQELQKHTMAFLWSITRVNSYNTVTHVTYRYQNQKFYRCSTNTSDICNVQQNTGSYPPNSLENFWNRKKKKMYEASSIEPATIRKFESIIIM